MLVIKLSNYIYINVGLSFFLIELLFFNLFISTKLMWKIKLPLCVM